MDCNMILKYVKDTNSLVQYRQVLWKLPELALQIKWYLQPSQWETKVDQLKETPWKKGCSRYATKKHSVVKLQF